MHGTGRVADRRLGVLARVLYGLDRDAKIAQVVQGIEDTEHIDAVAGGALDEGAHHIVGIVAVAQQVLPPQQHLQARIGQGLAEASQSLPGVFLEVAKTGIEGGPAPDLQGPEAGAVQALAHGQHVLRAHARGNQRLVRVAQHRVRDFYLGHGLAVFLSAFRSTTGLRCLIGELRHLNGCGALYRDTL